MATHSSTCGSARDEAGPLHVARPAMRLGHGRGYYDYHYYDDYNDYYDYYYYYNDYYDY